MIDLSGVAGTVMGDDTKAQSLVLEARKRQSSSGGLFGFLKVRITDHITS